MAKKTIFCRSIFYKKNERKKERKNKMTELIFVLHEIFAYIFLNKSVAIKKS